jgi:Tfp pilus assembly protein PilV
VNTSICGSSESGFTLLEVLISALILFAVVATSTQVYRSGIGSSKKAAVYVQVLSEVPRIKAQITREIRANAVAEHLEGEGQISEAVVYAWKAEPVYNGATASALVAETAGGGNLLILWRVEFEVVRSELRIPFEFWELSWRPL